MAAAVSNSAPSVLGEKSGEADSTGHWTQNLLDVAQHQFRFSSILFWSKAMSLKRGCKSSYPAGCANPNPTVRNIQLKRAANNSKWNNNQKQDVINLSNTSTSVNDSLTMAVPTIKRRVVAKLIFIFSLVDATRLYLTYSHPEIIIQIVEGPSWCCVMSTSEALEKTEPWRNVPVLRW